MEISVLKIVYLKLIIALQLVLILTLVAGVSQSTVSRALRNSPLVNDETRRRVHDIAKKLNYKVDKNASNLRTQQSSTLALLLFEDPTSDESQINPFFLAMLGSITRACAKEGYDLLVSFQSASADWQADYEDSHRADGIILLGYGDYIDFQPKFNTLLEQNTKFVCWGASVDNRPDLTISCDNYGGGKLAAEHLLAHRAQPNPLAEGETVVTQQSIIDVNQDDSRAFVFNRLTFSSNLGFTFLASNVREIGYSTL